MSGALIGAVNGVARLEAQAPTASTSTSAATTASSPPPPPPPVKQKLVLRGVHFDFNKSKIRPGDAAVLEKAASTLKANPSVTSTSTVIATRWVAKTTTSSCAIGAANSVVNYLVKAGIPSSQLIQHGYGKTDFVATNKTAEGRAQNRRVELVPNQ